MELRKKMGVMGCKLAKWYEMVHTLLLFTHRKSHKEFQLVPKVVTKNDLERRNGNYVALFHRIR